jgi:hypothetical protein
MVDSGLGRIDLVELGKRRLQTRWATKADHGHVWKPRTALTLVDTQALEPAMHVLGQRGRTALVVCKDEHADAARLAIAVDVQRGRPSAGRCLAERGRDRRELLHRAPTEERKCDVQVLARHDSNVRRSRECVALPLAQTVERVLRQAQCEEETDSLTTLDASREIHAEL